MRAASLQHKFRRVYIHIYAGLMASAKRGVALK